MKIHYNDFWLKYMNKSYHYVAIRRGKEECWEREGGRHKNKKLTLSALFLREAG